MKKNINFDSLYKTLFDDKPKAKERVLGIIDSENILSIILSVGLLSVAYVAYLLHESGEGVDVDILLNIFYIFFAPLIWILSPLFNRHNEKKYIIKGALVYPLIKGINPTFKYRAFDYVPKDIFINSKIFTKSISSYLGNDLVMGKVDDNYILFSDLLVKNFVQTVFEGQFIVTEFNKDFKGETVVTMDHAQAVFGKLIGGFIQSHSSKNLIKMDNPKFEEAFVIHSTDSVEAHYILTPSMMERILSFQEKTKHSIEISFINNAMFIAITYANDKFESIDSFVDLPEKELKEAFHEEFEKPLELVTSIIQELKLNEKLWSKR